VKITSEFKNSIGSRRRFGARGPTRAVVVFLWVCFLFQVAVNAQVKEIRRVLILDDLGVISSPGFAEIDRAISDTLQESPYQIELYYESLELTLFSNELYQRRFREQFIQKYSDRKPDVIITAGSASLNFIAELDKPFVRDTPIVFCTVLGEIPHRTSPDMHFTGVLGRLHPEETLNAALRLLPSTKHVAVVGGMGPFDVKWEAIAKQSFQKYESRLEFIYLTDLTMPALLERLKRLPSDTIVYHTAFTVDAAGSRFIDSAQSVPLVASAANAPVFVMDDVDFRAGTLGGDLVNWADDARVAAEMAVRVLNGAKPQDIPIVTSADNYIFDWPALQRWGLKESNLPPGSIVLNRPQSLWQLYKRYVLAGTIVLLMQTGAIFALLWQRARKRRVEAELTRSEEKFSKTFRQSPLVLTISRTSDSRFIDVNASFEQQLGWKRDEVIGRTPPDCDLWVDADQRAAFKSQVLANGSVRDLEVRIRRKDGEIRTLLLSAEVIRVGGEHCTLSVAADITERKKAEEALSTVNRRLIEAQEEERTRIARELHDDINQRLALLAVELSVLGNDIPASETSTRQRVEQVNEEVADLGRDVQSLSHRLHSSKLEYLGLAVAARGFCKEFSERHNVEIEFHTGDIPRNLPSEISLSLFRVLQEALQNAAKYSGTQQFEATLESTPSEIQLTVHDSGVGFDAYSTTSGHGLGLVSMTERLKLVGGQLFIDSKPHCGTTICARVPLVESNRKGCKT
jgi:PAS domain S-box-containing protein